MVSSVESGGAITEAAVVPRASTAVKPFVLDESIHTAGFPHLIIAT